VGATGSTTTTGSPTSTPDMGPSTGRTTTTPARGRHTGPDGAPGAGGPASGTTTDSGTNPTPH
jgi:hypothetical protein